MRVRLPERTVLQGFVVDPDGRPIPWASVRVRPGEETPEEESCALEELEREVGIRGAFAFTDLEEGFYRVEAEAEGYVPQEVRRVLLDRTQPAVNLRFVLERTSRE
jgi:hypothetical protein